MEEALEQYLVLAKSARGKAAEALIIQALANQNTFVFGELIDMLEHSDVSQGHLELLDIFAYGTYTDYETRRSRLPDISPVHLRKLKMLSLATLAASAQLLSYAELQSTLQISSLRELEDLIIDSIYQGLISGKLDHKLSALQVNSAFGRDVRPDQAPTLLHKLTSYLQQVAGVDALIEKQLQEIENARTHVHLRVQDFNEKLKAERELTFQELSAMMEIKKSRDDRSLFRGLRRGFLG